MLLITGASGLLGSNLVLAAQSRSLETVAASHRATLSVPGIKSYQADLTSSAQINDLVLACRPRWIIHAAAATNVDWCEDHPDTCWQMNVEMPRSIAAAARAVDARFIYISTDSVFDGQRGSYTEYDVPAPLNRYASSKLTAEQAVQQELDHALIVRTNFYGWNLQNKPSLAEWILASLRSKSSVNGFTDVIFSPLLVNDLADFLLDLMTLDVKGIYHLVGAEACSKHDFAVHLADMFQLDRALVKPARIADMPLHAPRPKNTSLNIARVVEALGRPMPNLLSGLGTFRRLYEAGYPVRLKAALGG